jgi:hypothetical protein
VAVPRPRKYREDIPGLGVRRTARGWVVIEIDPWANPAKDEAWLDQKRRSAVSEVAFRREYLRDWMSAAGQSFYPEFMERPERYIRAATGLLRDLPVIRGWDFGYRRPACVWLQFSPKSGRVWVLRELLGQNIDTHSFRDLVLYLSGERDIEFLKRRPKAIERVNAIREDRRLPPPPWFDGSGGPVHFIDYAGPEALQRRAAVEGEDAARADAEVLAQEGIRLGVYHTTVKAREQICRRLLLTRPDGHPGMLLDPACRDLVLGLGGRIAYKRPTRDNPMPDEPAKDGYYEHLHDALGYALVNVVPVAEELPSAPVHARPQRWGAEEPIEHGEGFEVREMTVSTW